MKRASLTARFFAFVIDVAFLWCVSGLMSASIIAGHLTAAERVSLKDPIAAALEILLVFFLVETFLFLFYFTYLTAHGEMTLGKSIFRLKVVRRGDEQGTRFGPCLWQGVRLRGFRASLSPRLPYGVCLERKGFSRYSCRDQGGAGGIMGGSERGKAGCGCLLLILVVCMVIAAALMHPLSLRLISGRFLYEDKVAPCDAIFVPRAAEDRSGEVYSDAFREYWAGSGKTIWIENDRLLGLTLKDIVEKMAKARGIKEGSVKALDLDGDEAAKAEEVKETFARRGVRRVLVIVPEYASRRFHRLYGSGGSGQEKVLFLIKPAKVSYFKSDSWWKGPASRSLVEREASELALSYVNHLRGGKKEKGTDEPKKE